MLTVEGTHSCCEKQLQQLFLLVALRAVISSFRSDNSKLHIKKNTSIPFLDMKMFLFEKFLIFL
jgi:hypothetical protein